MEYHLGNFAYVITFPRDVIHKILPIWLNLSSFSSFWCSSKLLLPLLSRTVTQLGWFLVQWEILLSMYYCGETITHGSQISACLLNRDTASVCSRQLFQDVHKASNVSIKRECLIQEQWIDFFAVQDNKTNVFLWDKGWAGLFAQLLKNCGSLRS